ncbi:hypothetical protein PROPEN_03204 [Proteus penneri ATCC 35198]|nr:hypothetical protein PROPEN_03204 [Proteus penneri ATCC 35198]
MRFSMRLRATNSRLSISLIRQPAGALIKKLVRLKEEKKEQYCLKSQC